MGMPLEIAIREQGDRGDGKPDLPIPNSVKAKGCFQLPSG